MKTKNLGEIVKRYIKNSVIFVVLCFVITSCSSGLSLDSIKNSLVNAGAVYDEEESKAFNELWKTKLEEVGIVQGLLLELDGESINILEFKNAEATVKNYSTEIEESDSFIAYNGNFSIESTSKDAVKIFMSLFSDGTISNIDKIPVRDVPTEAKEVAENLDDILYVFEQSGCEIDWSLERNITLLPSDNVLDAQNFMYGDEPVEVREYEAEKFLYREFEQGDTKLVPNDQTSINGKFIIVTYSEEAREIFLNIKTGATINPDEYFGLTEQATETEEVAVTETEKGNVNNGFGFELSDSLTFDTIFESDVFVSKLKTLMGTENYEYFKECSQSTTNVYTSGNNIVLEGAVPGLYSIMESYLEIGQDGSIVVAYIDIDSDNNTKSHYFSNTQNSGILTDSAYNWLRNFNCQVVFENSIPTEDEINGTYSKKDGSATVNISNVAFSTYAEYGGNEIESIYSSDFFANASYGANTGMIEDVVDIRKHTDGTFDAYYFTDYSEDYFIVSFSKQGLVLFENGTFGGMNVSFDGQYTK